MIKIRVGDVEESFESNQAALRYVADMAGDSPLEFQRLSYEHGQLVEMDFLTYNRGRLTETHSTRK